MDYTCMDYTWEIKTLDQCAIILHYFLALMLLFYIAKCISD